VLGAALAIVVQAGLRDKLAPVRDLDLKTFPHVFTAQLTRMQAKPKELSILWFGFTTWGFPRFRVQYFEKDASGNAKFKFRFGLLHVAEYNDTTPDFNRANVIPGRGIRLLGRGPEWTDIVYTQADANGVRTATTSLNDPRGTVTIKAKVAPRFVQDGNATLAPNKIKFDLSISNFQYQYSTSKLAVLGVMTMKSDFNPKKNSGAASGGDADDQDEVDLSSAATGDGGRFAWVRKAWDNGNGKPVTIKTLPIADADDNDFAGAKTGASGDVGDDDKDPDEVAKLVVFIFDANGQPNSLLWDPDVVIDDNASGRVSASLVVVLLAVLASFFGKFF
jgi:hypothetical protein